MWTSDLGSEGRRFESFRSDHEKQYETRVASGFAGFCFWGSCERGVLYGGMNRALILAHLWQEARQGRSTHPHQALTLRTTRPACDSD